MKFRRGFWSGYFLCVCVTGLIQDWRGLEGSIAAMRTGWINTPWWIWPILGAFAMASGMKKRKDGES